ncbi:MAG: serine/threonine-protein kinase, partial [archaeon]|nr:serine/threonine-protein kinase [archaeon]
FFGGDRSIAAKPIMSASSSSSTLALQQPSSGSPSASPVHSALRLNRIEDAFTLGAELGRGTFGAVRVGISRASGRKSAIKQIQKSSLSTDILHKLELEIVILKRASHPNIVNLEAVFQTQDSVYLVAEVAEGGNLFNRMKAVKTYSELEASALVKNVCCAIEYLHKMNIVHRDIKPENILLVSPTDNIDVKLADFGLSCYFSGAASLLTRVGTPLYVAPEILSNKGYGPAVDMWAVGVLTFCLLSGKPPFPCQDLAVLYQYIMQAKFSFDDPVWLKISTEAKEFIKSLLKVEPSLRLSAPRAFRHPWVQQKHTGLAPGNMNVDQAFGKYIDLLASH